MERVRRFLTARDPGENVTRFGVEITTRPDGLSTRWISRQKPGDPTDVR